MEIDGVTKNQETKCFTFPEFPFRMRRSPTDEFFDEGNEACWARHKQLVLPDSAEGGSHEDER